MTDHRPAERRRNRRQTTSGTSVTTRDGPEAPVRQQRGERAAVGGGSTDYEQFTIVGDLLRETVAAPHVRAALYRVAAGLGGVELIGLMTDRAGRTGTAVAMTTDQSSRGLERRIPIFDPQTSTLLAEEDVLIHKVDWLDGNPPAVIGHDTYFFSDVVSTIPQVAPTSGQPRTPAMAAPNRRALRRA